MITKKEIQIIIGNYYDRKCEKIEIEMIGENEERQIDISYKKVEESTSVFMMNLDNYEDELIELVTLAQILNSSNHGLSDETYIECLDYYMLNATFVLDKTIDFIAILKKSNNVNGFKGFES